MPHTKVRRSAPRDVLTPAALEILQEIAVQGSFAAAARKLGMVPSALTYRVRQIEESLDVLLFDRRSRQARLTAAGSELIQEGERLLREVDAVANRVRRVATGWEPQFTIAVDSIINQSTVLALCAEFLALNPPTRLRIRTETLSGTLEALTSGRADLALGVSALASTDARVPEIAAAPIGTQHFVFAVAPQHPLARVKEPLDDALIRQHLIVATADTTPHGEGLTVGLLSGQAVFTVATMQAKLEAQLRGLGCGFLPAGLAQPHIASGKLIAKQVRRPEHAVMTHYAWRTAPLANQGLALRWWLHALATAQTRQALLCA